MRWVLKCLKGRRVRGRELHMEIGKCKRQYQLLGYGNYRSPLLKPPEVNPKRREEQRTNACCGVTKMFYRQFP